MTAMKPIAALSLLVGLLALLPLAWAQHDPSMHHMDHMQMQPPGAPEPGLPPDVRQLVNFPAPLRDHTLASMRDHLLTLQKIQQALASGQYDIAATTAEQRLGLSSLGLHQAHEVAKFMPQGMQDAGTAMHRAASRFAIAAQTAGATGDVKPALAALSQVTMACVSCHAGYRLH